MPFTISSVVSAIMLVVFSLIGPVFFWEASDLAFPDDQVRFFNLPVRLDINDTKIANHTMNLVTGNRTTLLADLGYDVTNENNTEDPNTFLVYASLDDGVSIYDYNNDGIIDYTDAIPFTFN